MGYFEWDSSLDSGINVIDAQHRQIVDYINLLHVAISKNDQAAIHEIIDEVVNYTLTHFSFEEEMMKEAGYPHYEAHCAVHQSFTKRVHEHRNRLKRGEDVAKQLLSDLRIWLTNHIKNEDRDYANGVKVYLHGSDEMGWLSKTLGRFFHPK